MAVQARSMALSRYGTHREAVVLAALVGSGIAVPAVHGYHPGHGTLLLDRVPGRAELPTEPAARAAVLRAYGRELAALHALDAARFSRVAELDAVRGDRPGEPGPLAAVLADYDRHPGRPDPLVDLARGWLARDPAPGGGHCLLHGDAGPQQFLAEDGRLTGLLDWELAHLGHPMSDLGYARFREGLYPTGAFGAFVTAYATTSGRPVHRSSVDHFTVAAGLLMLAGVSADVRHPRAHHPESLQRFWWDALARAAICQVLGESLGHPPQGVPGRSGGGTDDGELGALAGLLTARLELAASANLAGGEARARSGGSGEAPGGTAHTLLLARAVERVARRCGSGHADTDALLGRHLADPERRHAAVTTLVREHGAERLDDLVRYFGHRALRRLAALAPLAGTDTWPGGPAPVDRPPGPPLPPLP